MGNVQIINCLCGATIAACRVPECYEDAEWQKNMRKYVRKGYTVEIHENSNWKFGGCTCPPKENKRKKKHLTQIPIPFTYENQD
jgi:hypothetical protein